MLEQLPKTITDRWGNDVSIKARWLPMCKLWAVGYFTLRTKKGILLKNEDVGRGKTLELAVTDLIKRMKT